MRADVPWWSGPVECPGARSEHVLDGAVLLLEIVQGGPPRRVGERPQDGPEAVVLCGLVAQDRGDEEAPAATQAEPRDRLEQGRSHGRREVGEVAAERMVHEVGPGQVHRAGRRNGLSGEADLGGPGVEGGSVHFGVPGSLVRHEAASASGASATTGAEATRRWADTDSTDLGTGTQAALRVRSRVPRRRPEPLVGSRRWTNQPAPQYFRRTGHHIVGQPTGLSTSRPRKGRSASGTTTEPSGCWWFSRIATIHRVVARVPLRVATVRVPDPSGSRSRVFSRRAWNVVQLDVEVTSRYLPCVGTQASQSNLRAAGPPRSPPRCR